LTLETFTPALRSTSKSAAAHAIVNQCGNECRTPNKAVVENLADWFGKLVFGCDIVTLLGYLKTERDHQKWLMIVVSAIAP